jgi:mono/diheme cytochrome c family protein
LRTPLFPEWIAMNHARLIALLAVVALPSWALAESSSWPTKRSSDTDWGQDLYDKHCWQCHGRKAEGDGPAAAALQVPVPALRGTSDDATRGDLVTTARQGSGTMPAYHESISRQDMRRVFLYIESLDKPEKKPEASTEDADPELPTEEGNAPDAPDAPDAEGGE